MAEIHKAHDIIEPYLKGNVLELGSGGWPCCPHAIQLDLQRFHHPEYDLPPVQLVWNAFTRLPFDNGTFDTLVASHVLEDTSDWFPVLREWMRVVKTGGHLIIQVPDLKRFRAVVAANPLAENPNHKHESFVGELSMYAEKLGGLRVILDKFQPETDYNILFIAQRL